MCGILGYIGEKKSMEELIDGLKRLEYRGYDSAGVAAVAPNGKVIFAKSQGRISALEEKLPEGLEVCSGIFHTRWATHGEPSDENAHPQADCKGKIFVVHNGIIENYKELKEKLEKLGHNFLSRTDTEVIPHLLEEIQKHKKASFEEVLSESLGQMKGSYALVAINSAGDKIVAARESSPLILGIGDSGLFLASDPSAILPFTRDVVYLNDGDIVVLELGKYKILSRALKNVDRKSVVLEWNIEEASKRGFPHFMLKEIFEEPEAVENAIRGRILLDIGSAKLGGLEDVKDRLKSIDRIVIAACGTAYYAGLIGEYMIEELAGIPVEVEYASEFRYRHPVLGPNTAFLAISQSGETADTLAALREAKKKGALTLGIVNVVGSTIARETDAGIYNHAGPEIAVASTKALVSQISVLATFALFLGRTKNMPLSQAKGIVAELQKIPRKMNEVLRYSDEIKEIAGKYAKHENFFYLGRKYNYPVALEGALKLKEISYAHAEGIGAGEMKHGPIALIDRNFPSIFIAPRDSVYDKTFSNIEEVKARGGKVIAIASRRDEKIKEAADDVIYVPETLEMLYPLLTALPLHLFAYYFAVSRGCDVDKPKNLAKSVTVE